MNVQREVEKYATMVAAISQRQSKSSNNNGKGVRVELQTAKTKAIKTLTAKLRELKRVHALPSDLDLDDSLTNYDCEKFDPTDMPQVLPWAPSKCRVEPRVKAEQHYLRAREEKALVTRKVRSAISFYEHHIQVRGRRPLLRLLAPVPHHEPHPPAAWAAIRTGRARQCTLSAAHTLAHTCAPP